jgi:hypothetical protein
VSGAGIVQVDNRTPMLPGRELFYIVGARVMAIGVDRQCRCEGWTRHLSLSALLPSLARASITLTGLRWLILDDSRGQRNARSVEYSTAGSSEPEAPNAA